MSLANKEWESDYPTTQDADPLATGTQQPDQENETFPEAGDGNNVRVSHVHTLRDKVQEIAKKVGDDSNNPAGCHAEKIAALESAPPSHKATHQDGGGDEISVAGLSGLLADDQNPVDHASDHQDGGTDEISVAGLSGVLGDDQVANKLRETSGPTLLDIGDLVDGEFLKRDGTDIVSAEAGGGFGTSEGLYGGRQVIGGAGTLKIGSPLGPIVSFPLSTTFEAENGEWVELGFSALWSSASTIVYFQLRLDGTLLTPQYRKSTTNSSVNVSFPYQMTSSGTHTLELYAYSSTATVTLQVQGTFVWYERFRGGYTIKENHPTIDGTSFSGDTFDLTRAYAGAETTFRVLLNDGRRYTKAGPTISMDYGTNGLGGLEGSLSPTNDTVYYNYAVVDSGDTFGVVGSDQSPDDGGPTNYDTWLYLGAVPRKSGALLTVFQEGGTFRLAEEYLALNINTLASWTSLSLSSVVPKSVASVDLKAYLNAGGGYGALRVSSDDPTYGSRIYCWATAGTVDTNTADTPVTQSPPAVDYQITGNAPTAARIYLRGWVDKWLAQVPAQTQAEYQPDNIPAFERDATNNYQINAIAAPSRPGTFVLRLGDDKYIATSPICAMNTTGVGGRDATEALSTGLWNIFAVPSGTPGEFGLVASKAIPTSGPPSHTTFKYLWTVYCTSAATGQLWRFYQRGKWNFFYSPQQFAYHNFTSASPSVGTWASMDTGSSFIDTPLGNLVPLDIAGQVRLRAWYDCDANHTFRFTVAGGDPPTASMAQTHTFLTGQDESHGEAAQIADVVCAGGVSYGWDYFTGSSIEIWMSIWGYENQYYPGT